ncbi:hypothetical protein ACLOJK_028975 [Asimina triloba]
MRREVCRVENEKGCKRNKKKEILTLFAREIRCLITETLLYSKLEKEEASTKEQQQQPQGNLAAQMIASRQVDWIVNGKGRARAKEMRGMRHGDGELWRTLIDRKMGWDGVFSKF